MASVMRSRRSIAPLPATAALESLRAARAGHKRRAEQIILPSDGGDIYAEMTEEEYQQLLESRRAEAFVDDQDGDNEYMNLEEDIDDWGDDGSATAQERYKRISKVAMQARQRKQQAQQPVEPTRVAGAFMRTKAMVGPGTGKTQSDDVDVANLDDMLQEIDEEVNDVAEVMKESNKKRKDLSEAAFFGGAAQLESSMNESTGYTWPGSGRNSQHIASKDVNINGTKIMHRDDKETYIRAVPRYDINSIWDDVENQENQQPKTEPSLNFGKSDDFVEAAIGSARPVMNVKTEFGASELYDPVAGMVRPRVPVAESTATDRTIAPAPLTNKPLFSGLSKAKIASRTSLPPQAVQKSNPKAFDFNALLKTGILDKPLPVTDGLQSATEINNVQHDVPHNVDPEGSFVHMYWIDAYEDPIHSPGNLYLFGKAIMPGKRRGDNPVSTSSCMVTITGIERQMFILPRKYWLTKSDDAVDNRGCHGISDQKEVQMVDVYSEVSNLMKTLGVKNFKSKPVEKEYVFERDATISTQELATLQDPTAVVPRKSQYLELVYSFKDRAIPRNHEGETFSKVFGAKSSALELFFAKKDLMGPCWLTLGGLTPVAQQNKVSWAQFEYVCDNLNNIAVMPAPFPAPLFSLMSLSIKTKQQQNNNKHEIVMISMLTHKSVNVEGPTQHQYALQYQTLLTNGGTGAAWLPDMDPWCKEVNKGMHGHEERIKRCRSELELLNLFTLALQRHDPDIIVGQDLHGFMLEVLLQRMKALKIGQWSKIGRLRKSKFPQLSDGDGVSLIDRGIGCGRLLADTLVSAKELLLGQKNYTLSYLAQTQLDGVYHAEVDSLSVKGYFVNDKGNSEMVRTLVRNNENEAFLSLRLVYQLEVLPLTLQLTNLCGNLWSRTMKASRAERVEYLLLHEFYKSNYIVPEKYTGKERRQRQAKASIANAEGDEDEDGEQLVSLKKRGRGKPLYSGGLVLEPKIGFYDRFILLLDFNSLYPSIIQEYNLCFTTVNHFTKLPDGAFAKPPPPGTEIGKLPIVLRRLIERRRAVKAMIKSESNPSKLKQLDIRQKALKLVANSMYGCLGFVNSRFYCEPIAALVTSKGRETLQNTVEITEKLGLAVIYGDTDSIMVYTNETELEKVYKIGKDIQKAVNDRHKVLEIGIDGIFKNMLLLRKKKYAALVVGDNGELKAETKGLDLVRRDWCPLSKKIGRAVLDAILDPSAQRCREDTVNVIHALLEKTRDDIDNNLIPLSDFVITKGLTKAIKEYNDANSQPHVRVAMQMISIGKRVNTGDFIPYVICQGDGPISMRAYHPETVEKADGALQIDIHWYKSNQLIPPVARLCAPIEETDAARIAHCLGLDPKGFQNFGGRSETVRTDSEIIIVRSIEDEYERFRDVEPLYVICDVCGSKQRFKGVYDFSPLQSKLQEDIKLQSGLCCSTPGCKGFEPSEEPHLFASLCNQLNLETRRHVQSYYQSYFKCSDSSCSRRTRQIYVRGDKCTVPKCQGLLEREYGHEQLHLQLDYFASLFDVSRADCIVASEAKRRKEAGLGDRTEGGLPELHLHVFKQLHELASRFLQQNAYHWVSLGDLFSFAIRI